VEKSILLKFGYPSRLFALWSGEFFRIFNLFATVKFCHRMPTTMLPLPSFRDLPAIMANVTATPGLPAHLVATPAPPPLHLPTLVATTAAPPPVALQPSCNTSLAEVSSLLWTHSIGERGEEGHCVRNNTTFNYG
jgi:hypothetical protein